MNLNEPTQENLKYILNELAERLDIANRILVDEKDFLEDMRYKDMYLFQFQKLLKRK